MFVFFNFVLIDNIYLKKKRDHYQEPIYVVKSYIQLKLPGADVPVILTQKFQLIVQSVRAYAAIKMIWKIFLLINAVALSINNQIFSSMMRIIL